MNNPLVSIVVITYNSSQFIIKTLESVKLQTYKNIELIISDDCSKDNTVEICKKWLEVNGKYFQSTKLITSNKNTGVAGNLNKGIINANGVWIKPLAGDDLFFPYTIQEYIDYTLIHPDCSIVEALMEIRGSNKIKVKRTINRYNDIFNQIRDTNNQYRRCLINCFFPGPSIFFRKELFNIIGGYDDQYQFCEEYPFSLYVLKKVQIIPLIEKKLIIYTINDTSISHADKVNVRNLKDNISFFRNYRSRELLKRFMFFNWLDIASKYYHSETLVLYPNSKIRRTLSILFILISPITVYRKVKERINRTLDSIRNRR